MLQFEKQLNPQGAVQGVSSVFQEEECALLVEIEEHNAEEIEDLNLDVVMEEELSTSMSAQKKTTSSKKKNVRSERQSLLRKNEHQRLLPVPKKACGSRRKKIKIDGKKRQKRGKFVLKRNANQKFETTNKRKGA